MPKERTQIRTDDFAKTVNRMTNRERHRWAKAHYPGLRQRDTDKLLPFVLMEKISIKRVLKPRGKKPTN